MSFQGTTRAFLVEGPMSSSWSQRRWRIVVVQHRWLLVMWRIGCGYLVGPEMFFDKKVGVVKEAKTIGEDEDEANPYRNCRVTPGWCECEGSLWSRTKSWYDWGASAHRCSAIWDLIFFFCETFAKYCVLCLHYVTIPKQELKHV